MNILKEKKKKQTNTEIVKKNDSETYREYKMWWGS